MTILTERGKAITVPLREVISESRSGFASGDRADDGVIQVRMHNVDLGGRLNLTRAIRIPATSNQLKEFALRPGDVLFNNTNSTDLVGKTAYFCGHSEAVLFSNHFTRLRVDSSKLEPRFLAKWLTHQQQRRVLEGLCTRWVNQSAIRAEKLLALRIPLPTLEEQRRLADILDKAETIRRRQHDASKVLSEYPHSMFIEMFGHPFRNSKNWPIVPFAAVCESRLGKMLDGKQQTGRHCRPYLRNLNVQWDHLDLSEIFEMDFDENDRKEFRLRYSDVLICEGGAGVGQTAIWRDEVPECYFQKSLHRVRPSAEHATSEYIAFLMWTLMNGSSLFASISSATIPHLTGEKLRQIRIPLPPISLQREFQRHYLRYRSATQNFADSVVDADRLYDSLVQRAFRGDL